MHERKQSKKLKHIKVIMVSERTMESERRKWIEAGADEYITKPFDEDALLDTVR